MTAKNIKGFVIAGERSGVGKTILTLAMAQAFMERGLRVQCFKVGPDFIDPGFHQAVTGRTSRNLDGWMMGRDYSICSFEENVQDADMAIVEGVMGLFDGHNGKSDDGSTAQIAKWLNLPVVLVVDGSSLARTAGALVLGFENYDPEIEVAGVIFNRVAGKRHYEYLREGVQAKCHADVLGYVTRSPEWHVPERHLGLVMASECDSLKQTIQSLLREIEKTVNFESMMKYCRQGKKFAKDSRDNQKALSSEKKAAIGVARDEAFCFYYQDNIDFLQHYGAGIKYFSPIHDEKLPEGIQGLYLGGGYPELYASDLHRNHKMREEILGFCKSGRPVYAECGGFLYLLRAVTDQKGECFDMVGLFPAEARMLTHVRRLGYVEVEATNGCKFIADGERIRGHEFHYSELSDMPGHIDRCYRVYRGRAKEFLPEGFRIDNVLAGYMHLHFASNPDFAKNFVGMCREQRGKVASKE
jgi:cobyrinic acid a,c-diamide synthase